MNTANSWRKAGANSPLSCEGEHLGFRRFRKIPALWLVALTLMAGLLGACATPFSNLKLSELWRPQAQTTSVFGLEVLVWPSSGEEDTALREIVSSIDDLNPGLQITLTFAAEYERELANSLESPSPPDVFLITGAALPQLAEAGFVASLPATWLDPVQYNQLALEGASLDGRPHCFPHTLHTYALAYNPALLDRVGVAHPSANWTWQDFTTAAEAATDSDNGIFGAALSPDLARWLPFYLQAGGRLISPDSGALRFDEQPARQASDLLAGLFAAGYAAEPADLESSWAGEAFGRGKAAMTVEGSWLVPFLDAEFPSLDYGIAPLPAGPAGTASIAMVTCIAVNEAGPNRDLALQLAVQLANAEVLSRWAAPDHTLPVFANQNQDWLSRRPKAAPFLRALDYSSIWRFGPQKRSSLDAFTSALRLVADGELDASEFWPYLVRNGVVAPITGEPEVVPVP